jgi:hypothetical protein
MRPRSAAGAVPAAIAARCSARISASRSGPRRNSITATAAANTSADPVAIHARLPVGATSRGG